MDINAKVGGRAAPWNKGKLLGQNLQPTAPIYFVVPNRL